MGSQFQAICCACDYKFEVNRGPMMMARQIRCDTCGTDQFIDHDAWPTRPTTCECGGTLTDDEEKAPIRCPKCRCTDLRSDPDGGFILYD